MFVHRIIKHKHRKQEESKGDEEEHSGDTIDKGQHSGDITTGEQHTGGTTGRGTGGGIIGKGIDRISHVITSKLTHQPESGIPAGVMVPPGHSSGGIGGNVVVSPVQTAGNMDGSTSHLGPSINKQKF